jgi:hypothetical protein
MLHFPINPLLAKVLIASFELGCTSEVVDIIALREAGNPILESYSTREQADKMRRAFVHRDGDHMTGMNVLRAFLEVLEQARKENPQAAAGDKPVRKAVTDWCNEHSLSFRVLNEARLLRTQLQQLVKSTGQDPEVSAGEDSSRVMQCLSKGLYMNAARLQPDGLSYQPVLNRISDKVSRGESHQRARLADHRPAPLGRPQDSPLLGAGRQKGPYHCLRRDCKQIVCYSNTLTRPPDVYASDSSRRP